jgi:hypothetical protein
VRIFGPVQVAMSEGCVTCWLHATAWTGKEMLHCLAAAPFGFPPGCGCERAVCVQLGLLVVLRSVISSCHFFIQSGMPRQLWWLSRGYITPSSCGFRSHPQHGAPLFVNAMGACPPTSHPRVQRVSQRMHRISLKLPECNRVCTTALLAGSLNSMRVLVWLQLFVEICPQKAPLQSVLLPSCLSV